MYTHPYHCGTIKHLPTRNRVNPNSQSTTEKWLELDFHPLRIAWDNTSVAAVYSVISI